MSCREYQNQMILSLYEELPEGERGALEAHRLECDECRQAFRSQETFHTVLAEDTSAWELPPGLLVESRRALADELDRIEQRRSWWRLPTFSVAFTPMRMLESATLVAMGLAAGVYFSNHQAAPAAPAAFETASTISIIPQDGTVTNVRIVYADAASGKVEFAGDVMQPLRFEGRMEDDTTRRLLFSAVQDSMNPGSRLQALEVLSKESSEPSVKELFMQALLNDESLGVRLRALDGLKPFVGQEDVRAAFMQALMNDPNDGVRASVIDALAPFTNSSAQANRIEEVTRHDDNTYVRLRGQGLIQLVGTGR